MEDALSDQEERPKRNPWFSNSSEASAEMSRSPDATVRSLADQLDLMAILTEESNPLDTSTIMLKQEPIVEHDFASSSSSQCGEV